MHHLLSTINKPKRICSLNHANNTEFVRLKQNDVHNKYYYSCFAKLKLQKINKDINNTFKNIF